MYTVHSRYAPSDTSLLRTLSKVLLTGTALLLLALAAGFVYLHVRGSQPLSIQSGSMEPLLHKGDLVIANPVPVAALQPGDIVTFINPANRSQTITHRIVSIDLATRQVLTKGDANARPDKPFSTRLIVGRVDYMMPAVGGLIDVIRQPIGLLVIIYLPTLWVIGAELGRLARYYKSQKKYQLAERLHVARRNMRLAPAQAAAAIMVVAGLVGVAYPVSAALSSSSQLVSNSIATVTIPDSYQVCAFPETSTLLSYALIDVLYPEQPDPPILLDAPIIPGTYKITAESNDEHIIHPNAPTQPNERWFVQLYGADHSAPLHATGVTDDIPDDIDQTITVIDESATFTETVTAIRYAHNAFLTGLEKEQFGNRKFDELSEAEKRLVIWNSVHPGCITFERIRQ